MDRKAVLQNIGPPDENGCKLWLRGRGKDGYGHVVYAGKKQQAHRVVWRLLRGPIPDRLLVCHHCDNPPCCAIDHLFLATHAGNIRDRDGKGRTARGGANGQAKLDEADVLFMRCLHSGGTNVDSLAALYNVPRPTADKAIHGDTWKHVPLALPRAGITGENHPNSSLTESNVREAFRLHAEGLSQKEIALRLASSYGAINQVLRGRTWRHLGLWKGRVRD